MEIRVLKYFVESAKEESMTKAAAKLHVTQPTLSRQLKELEEELGQKFFVRSNYSIRLTPEGEILYKRAIDILDMVDRTTSEFESMKDFTGGDIYIGCAESEGFSYLAKAFKSLQEKFPQIRLHLYSGNAQTVTERLDKGLLDFAVVVQNVDIVKYDYFDFPSKDVWGLLMRKDSPLISKPVISYEELLQLPLILSRQGFTNEMPEWLRKNESKLNVVATYDLLFNATVLVKEGIGYALSFDKLANTSSDSILCFRPLSPLITSPMRMIWNQKQVLSKAASLLLAELREMNNQL